MKKRFLTVFLSVAMCLLSAFSMIGCKNKTFTVTFDPDGGELVSGELVQVVESASDIVEPELKKEGYTLKGWDTVLAEIDSDTTVKALWDKDKFTVRFIVDESTYYKSGELEQTVSSGEELVTPIYERKGYDLVWDTDLKTITSSCVVKGTWVAKKYTLSFADRAGNKISSISDIEVTYEGQISGLPTNYSEDGKDFLGWIIDNRRIENGSSWIWAENKTARPEMQYKEYKIYYNFEDNKLGGVDNKNNPREYDVDDEFTLTYPERVGYTFEGWVECNSEWEPINPGVTVKDVEFDQTTGDKYFKAEWKGIEYTIQLDLLTGHGVFVGGGTLDDDFSVIYGDPVTIPEINGENPTNFVFTDNGVEYRIWDGKIWTWTNINQEVFEAEYDTLYVITLNLTCEVRGREVKCTLPTGTKTEYTFMSGQPITGLPKNVGENIVVKPEDTEEYTFVAWRYDKDGNNSYSGTLKDIVDKVAGSEDFSEYEEDNGIVHITVYACCRANWTPAY